MQRIDNPINIGGCGGFMNAGTGCSIEISEESSNRAK